MLRDKAHNPVAQMNMRCLSGQETLIEFVYKGTKAVFPLPLTSEFVEFF